MLSSFSYITNILYPPYGHPQSWLIFLLAFTDKFPKVIYTMPPGLFHLFPKPLWQILSCHCWISASFVCLFVFVCLFLRVTHVFSAAFDIFDPQKHPLKQFSTIVHVTPRHDTRLLVLVVPGRLSSLILLQSIQSLPITSIKFNLYWFSLIEIYSLRLFIHTTGLTWDWINKHSCASKHVLLAKIWKCLPGKSCLHGYSRLNIFS